MTKRKKLTFQFSEGWLAHKEGKELSANPYKPTDRFFTVSSFEADWSDGWYGRETYIRNMPRLP